MKRYRIIILIAMLLLFGIDMQQAQAGGLIIVSPKGEWEMPIIGRPHPIPPQFNPFPLEVKSEKVSIKIEEQGATTAIDQVFYNPTNRRIEGYFLFPIPKNATIDYFSMYINGKEMEGELLDAKKARKIYEDIVRKHQDPALLEYRDRALFKARIFPIEPRSEKRVKITYTEMLSLEDGTIEYTYPLNTKKYAAKPIHDISIKADICSNNSIKNVYSPSHEVEIIRKGSQEVSIGFEADEVKPTSDFKLYYNTDQKQVGLSLLTHKTNKEDGFFFLTISPGYEDKTDIVEKDISFVLDVSGSMSGEKLEKAKEALLFCVNSLNEGDRFNIIRFSTEANNLYEKPKKASKEHIVEARTFIKELRAIGGTNISEALDLALHAKSKDNRPNIIVFITDGKPTIGSTDENEILTQLSKSNTDNTRIFTFGIGEDINTHLLDKITAHTKAYRSYILPSEDIEVKISNFYTKVSAPVLTNLQLDFPRSIQVYETYPKALPDLFKGASITILGRYKGSGSGQVQLSGTINGERKQFDFPIEFKAQSDKYEFIPPLWAARSVGYLLDQIRLHGENKELIDEVTKLARKYGIITPYTSYLILEDEADIVSRPPNRPRPPRPIPLPRPVPHFHNGAMEKEAISGDSTLDMEESYSSMKKREGKSSVRASKEIQEMNRATNIMQSQQGRERMIYTDTDGIQRNYADQFRNVQGRNFTQIANQQQQWVDDLVYQNQSAPQKNIKFASDEYFKLIDSEPESAEFLALGRNVQFFLNGNIYNITD